MCVNQHKKNHEFREFEIIAYTKQRDEKQKKVYYIKIYIHRKSTKLFKQKQIVYFLPLRNTTK